ncbi:MAG: polyphosphate:AMP phosphotransferase [Candidatus Zixiibacteriota bacterium]
MLTDTDSRRHHPHAKSKTEIEKLRIRLGEEQRLCRELGIPTVIAFAGFSAAGKGYVVGDLGQALDPRGFTVHTIQDPTPDEELRPPFWRFWTKQPENGRIGIFIRSWYSSLFGRAKGYRSPRERVDLCTRINIFERQLADSGCVMQKYYLHVSRKEQEKRFKALEKNPDTSWRITKDDWRQLKDYDNLLALSDEVLMATDKPQSPWIVLPADDLRSSSLFLMETLAERMQTARRERAPRSTAKSPKTAKPKAAPAASGSALARADLKQSLSRKVYDRDLERLQDRIRILQHRAYRKRLPVAIVYEGWDAAGKGGNIRRLVRTLDPRGYDVIPFAAPTDVEKRHHYLWRFWINAPRSGHIAIFDRSWYGRVLVEHVEGFCTPADYERAFTEIREMEKEWTDSGVLLIKFWLHISPEEQLRRFQAREKIAYKKWKITDEDWRNRKKWDAYAVAVDRMIRETSTPSAPWTIIEGDCKFHARVKALKTVVEGMEGRL